MRFSSTSSTGEAPGTSHTIFICPHIVLHYYYVQSTLEYTGIYYNETTMETGKINRYLRVNGTAHRYLMTKIYGTNDTYSYSSVHLSLIHI